MTQNPLHYTCKSIELTKNVNSDKPIRVICALWHDMRISICYMRFAVQRSNGAEASCALKFCIAHVQQLLVRKRSAIWTHGELVPKISAATLQQLLTVLLGRPHKTYRFTTKTISDGTWCDRVIIGLYGIQARWIKRKKNCHKSECFSPSGGKTTGSACAPITFPRSAIRVLLSAVLCSCLCCLPKF